MNTNTPRVRLQAKLKAEYERMEAKLRAMEAKLEGGHAGGAEGAADREEAPASLNGSASR
jgi:hypothetical protein